MRPRFIVPLVALAVMSVACGTASPAASTAPTATGAAPTAPGTPGPTTAPTQPGSTDGATFSIPSFVPDTTLEAAFPDQIDGQPVTNLTSLSILAFYQSWETPQAEIDAFIAAMQSVGVNPASVSQGYARATVGGADVAFSALRVPGGSAAVVVDQITRLSTDEPRVFTTGNLGGKPVTIATQTSADAGTVAVSYWYFNGEIAWALSDMDEAQAAVVLAALP